MKKIKNRLRKIIVMLCTVAAFLCCSLVSAFADEEASDPSLDLGYGPMGRDIPFLPDDVYGNDFVLLSGGAGTKLVYYLYLVPDDTIFTARYYHDSVGDVYINNGDNIIVLNIPEGTYVTCYRYSDDVGWTEPEIVNDLNPTIIPPYLFFVRSTVDIPNTYDNSIIFYKKNIDIILKNDIKVFLDDFGGLLTGSIGVISSSIVGVVGAFIVITPAVVGLFYALLRRN